MAEAPLWTPGAQRAGTSRLHRFMTGRGFGSYDELWRWSVDPSTTGDFWSAVADEFAVPWRQQPIATFEPDPARVPGARWFRGGRLNYAEAALANPFADPRRAAVTGTSDSRPPDSLSWEQLRDLVGRIRAGLQDRGVRQGDRVAGYLPNIPETMAAFLAAASLGAVWTCCAPEMGVAGVLDRLAQVEPVVLLACDGYRYGGRIIDRRQEAERIRAGLPTVGAGIWLPYLDAGASPPDGWQAWSDLTATSRPIEFEPCEFEHPLYILFSSGTTGRPKPIVHGHGGILVEHTKAIGWHFDVGPGDRFFWYTTTGWMMWNFLMSGLLVGATVVTFDGEPDDLWELMARQQVTCGGVGAGYLVACEKAGDQPGRRHDLTALRSLGATGSPLPASTASWVYRSGIDDLMLGSFSGGTDVCTGFVGPSPLHPVWAGEISCRCLGARVEVFDDEGKPLIGEEGDLVITAPLPSMPVAFWGDDGSRYRTAYYERFPGVWAHGDRATLTERGTVLITGRSDGTLNRGGVRMGTAEFYAVVEGMNEVADSLVVHLGGTAAERDELWLFVVPAPGADEERLSERIRTALRRDLSPRHVPDRIVMVPSVPRTLSGKKLEVPVKRILSGVAIEQALTVASVANPDSLDPIVELARERRRMSDRGPDAAPGPQP